MSHQAPLDGFLSSTNFNVFNGKQDTLSLTTTGITGNATLVGSTLNVPTIPAQIDHFEQSYRGFIDVSSDGIYVTKISSHPFEHTIDITGGFRARDASQAADYVCATGDKFMGLKGWIAGTRNEDITVEVLLHSITCGSAASDNKTLLGYQTLTLDRDDTPQCYDIALSTTSLYEGELYSYSFELPRRGFC